MWVDIQLVLAVGLSLLISVGRSIDPVLHTHRLGGRSGFNFQKRKKPDEKIQLEVPLNNATT